MKGSMLVLGLLGSKWASEGFLILPNPSARVALSSSSTTRAWSKTSLTKSATSIDINDQTLKDIKDETSTSAENRRMFLSAALVAAGTMLGGETVEAAAITDGPTTAIATRRNNDDATSSLPWETSPINKRSGVTVFDAEKSGYTVAFVTYLSRFLLNFDSNCQRWWFSDKRIPTKADAQEVERLRLEQFAAFSASVEVGLQEEYSGPDGVRKLFQDLLRRYGTLPEKIKEDGSSKGGDETTEAAVRKSQRRIAKSARRHIALLFALLEKTQPTTELTQLLASIDNGRVQSVRLTNKDQALSGYDKEPIVSFPQPEAGDNYETAQGRALLKSTGKILRVKVTDPGSGYRKDPLVTVSAPKNGGVAASVQAHVSTSKANKGMIESIQLVDPGSGYEQREPITIEIPGPEDTEQGHAAVAEAVLDMTLDGIEIVKQGSGYATEMPLKVFVEPPPTSGKSDKKPTASPILAGLAYPVAEKNSFSKFRSESDKQTMIDQEEKFESEFDLKPILGSTSGDDNGIPQLPFWSGKSRSSELLRLLPAGLGLEYDMSTKRYRLAVDTDFMQKYPAVVQQSSNRPIDPAFGPRGRSPIERDMKLGLAQYLRFSLSGAICATGVHLALTPLDVVKTKVQTNPEKYTSIGSSFQTVFGEEGWQTFFTGWIPTILGNFVGGGLLYALTEFIRRSLTEAAGVDAVNLEAPIILVAAGMAAAVGAALSCPFEAVRIRTVAQPDYAENSIDVVRKMVDEEGIGSLTNAIAIFLVKNIPYAMTKFTIFDLSTERLYEAFPAAQEEIKLSLLVSLVGGILGGTAAAIVSNPADAVISQLKKSQSDQSPQEVVTEMFERAGFAAFFAGLPLRMIYYSLIASLSFVVYDSVRLALGIGSDDLKLYLDVLGGALGNTGSVA